jgi:hypothetical protein
LISSIKIFALLTYIPLKLLILGDAPYVEKISNGGGDDKGFCETPFIVIELKKSKIIQLRFINLKNKLGAVCLIPVGGG